MIDTSLNTLWCRVIIEELIHGKLHHVVMCPDSHTKPMMMVCHQHPALETIMHTDERSAAFIAP